MHPSTKKLNATLTSHSLLTRERSESLESDNSFTRRSSLTQPGGTLSRGKGFPSSSPERNVKKISDEMERGKLLADQQYTEVEKILRTAKGIAEDIHLKLNQDNEREGSTPTRDTRRGGGGNYENQSIIHIDKNRQRLMPNPLPDVKLEEKYTSTTDSNINDYKLMVSQRDSELHALKQNYEIQYQESLILKQKVIFLICLYCHIYNTYTSDLMLSFIHSYTYSYNRH